MERAVILTEGDTIHARHLGDLGEVTRRVVSEVERRKIAAVLEQVGGDRGQAADVLQVSYKT